MNVVNTMIKVSLVALFAWLPMTSVNANPGGPGMMPCEMHKGPGMGPMGQGPMGDRLPMDGMPGNMMQHRRHQQMMKQRMAGKRGGMMKRQMMQQRMQHMQRMEERLGNIESLLQELVELQKQGQPAQQ